MANEIIETYKLMNERIKASEARNYFEMLDNPAVRKQAIQGVTKLKIETPVIRDYFDDTEPGVRLAVFKYLEELGKLEEDDILKCLNDNFVNLRKEAVRNYVSWGIEPYDKLIEIANDPDPKIRYELLKNVLEYNQEETANIIEKLKNDPDKKIKKLIMSVEDLKSVLLSDAALTIKKEAIRTNYSKYDSMEFYYKVREVYPDCNKTTKQIIIKFMAGLPADIIRTFIETKIDEEKDMEILFDLINTSRKVLGKDSVPAWLVDEFIKSTDPKFVSFGLKLATERDEMAYVDFARELLDNVDDEYVIGAMTYLSYFLDYTLSDRIPDFLNSVSPKRINTALKAVRKLKLDKWCEEISELLKDKKQPSSVRKAAINTLKYFKAKEYWETIYEIIRNNDEKSDVKLVALNALLRLKPEKIEEIG